MPTNDRHGPKNSCSIFDHILYKFVYGTTTEFYYRSIIAFHATNKTRILHTPLLYICFVF